MTVFLDSNIILDVLLKNGDFYDESRRVLTVTDTHPEIDLFISASSVTDIYYIVHKQIKDSEKVRGYLETLLSIVSIAGIDEACVKNALKSSWKDFEDAVQYESALQIRADYFVTRNIKDYEMTFVQVIMPADFLSVIDSKKKTS